MENVTASPQTMQPNQNKDPDGSHSNPLRVIKDEVNNLMIDQNTDQSGIFVFWYSECLNRQGELKWKINHLQLNYYLLKTGFRRFDINNDYTFIQIKDHIVEEIPTHRIQDNVFEYLNSINEDDLEGVTKEDLLSMFVRSPASYFNKVKLSTLGVESNLSFVSDDKGSGSVFYKNGFVKCTSEGYKLHGYQELEAHIFKNQIKDRNFKVMDPDPNGMFYRFVFNISGQNDKRFQSIQTLIGYLLHSFYETTMKAVNLTDSTISDNAEGGTGKSIIGVAISYIKNVCQILGKDFDPTDKNKYQSANFDTQMIFLNDVKKKFDFEMLFNDITDSIKVERKFLQPFYIKAKMLITSNDTFRIEGSSARRRLIEYELSNHYNEKYTPEDEFKSRLFSGWDTGEWLNFDNFMCGCLTSYLKNGIIEPDQINLNQRKLRSQTNPDFIDFMEEKVKDGEIKFNVFYDKKVLHEQFLEDYPEYRSDQWLKNSRNFNRYLITYSKYSSDLKSEAILKKTNGKAMIKFQTADEKNTELPF